MKKRNKGITLISLVITIIILLILAGIVLYLTIGQDGLIRKAQEAGKNYMQAQDKELAGIGELTNTFDKIANQIGGNSESGNDSGTVPDYKDLTVDERIEKIEKLGVEPKLFEYGDTDLTDYSSANFFNNSIGKSAQVGEKITCECKQVYNIYLKAEEMGLVKTYTDYEYSGTTDDENQYYTYGRTITAPVTEPSLAIFYYLCRNSEQDMTSSIYPVDMALNYEVRVANIFDKKDNSYWLDETFPRYGEKLGDCESCMMWLGQEFANLGYVTGGVRSLKYKQYTMEKIGQKMHQGWKILTQTDFLKAANALGINLSAYSCEHAK